MRTRRWQRLLPSISGTPTASKSSLTLSWSEMTTLTSLKIWCKPLFLKLWCENITYAFILLLLCLLVSDDGVLCQNLWRNVCKSTMDKIFLKSLCFNSRLRSRDSKSSFYGNFHNKFRNKDFFAENYAFNHKMHE